MLYRTPPLFSPHMKVGYTALMWAAQEGRQETVGTLIASGAIVDARDKVSMTNMKYCHSPSYSVDLPAFLFFI